MTRTRRILTMPIRALLALILFPVVSLLYVLELAFSDDTTEQLNAYYWSDWWNLVRGAL